MKTSVKSITTALLLSLCVLASLPGMSQDAYYSEKTFAAVMYPAKAESKLWLSLEQYKPKEKLRLELVNQTGQVLFSESLWGKMNQRNAYRQQFDMSQLVDGKYTFRISSDTHKEEFTFKLSTPTLEQTLPTRLIAINQ